MNNFAPPTFCEKLHLCYNLQTSYLHSTYYHLQPTPTTYNLHLPPTTYTYHLQPTPTTYKPTGYNLLTTLCKCDTIPTNTKGNTSDFLFTMEEYLIKIVVFKSKNAIIKI